MADLESSYHYRGCDCGGFDRNGSHAEGEYVGYCDHQEPVDDRLARIKEDLEFGFSTISLSEACWMVREIEALRSSNIIMSNASVNYNIEIERLQKAEHFLHNLLAVIHRDGGHYADDHGLEKATEDAITRVHDMMTTIEDQKYFLNNGGVPFDHWGHGCKDDCDIGIHHAAKKIEQLKRITNELLDEMSEGPYDSDAIERTRKSINE